MNNDLIRKLLLECFCDHRTCSVCQASNELKRLYNKLNRFNSAFEDITRITSDPQILKLINEARYQ
jgi:hypothetical protein